MSLSVETYRHKDQRVWQLFFRFFREGNYPITFLNEGHYLQSNLKSTVKRPSSIQKMKCPGTFEKLIFPHGIPLVNTSIATNNLSCFRTCATGTMIEYNVQKKTKAYGCACICRRSATVFGHGLLLSHFQSHEKLI